MGSIYKRGKTYWVKYYRNGRPCFESTHSGKKSVATRLLKIREGRVAEGRLPELRILKTCVDDLVDLYLKDYENNGRKSIVRARQFAELIKERFAGMRAAHITTEQIMDYRIERREEGVKDSTINRELAALRRMFRLGQKQSPPMVDQIPNIEFVRENNVRRGFFELEEFYALREALPDHLKVAATIAYFTGMRLGEILDLRWDHIDWDNGTIRLDPGTTKNNEGRLLPMMSDVRETLEQWWLKTEKDSPKCPWICHYRGERFSRIYRAWRTACKRVGLEGRLFHDLRRSAVRNLVRAGVPQAVAKKISGHKTDSVFNRYNIVSQGDLMEATKQISKYIHKKRNQIQNGYNLVTISHPGLQPASQVIEK